MRTAKEVFGLVVEDEKVGIFSDGVAYLYSPYLSQGILDQQVCEPEDKDHLYDLYCQWSEGNGVIQENEEIFLMNPFSGTVQSKLDWTSDAKNKGWAFEEAKLVEVSFSSGSWKPIL